MPDAARGETSYAFPSFLPNGRHYLFMIGSTDGRFAAYLGELGSDERIPLTGIESMAIYSATGHVLFLRNGALMAQPFDAGTLRLHGEAVAVQERFTAPAARSTGRFDVANGVVAFAGGTVRRDSSLVWFDRDGRRLGEAAPFGVYGNPELSKDDRFVSWDEGGGPEGEIWVRDLTRGLTTRLTSAPGNQGIAQWSPDGARIAYRSDRDGALGVLVSRDFGVVDDESVLL